MNTDIRITIHLCLALVLVTSGEAFFLRWGSENSQTAAPKAWVSTQMAPISQSYRGGYGYLQSAYDQRKPQYQQVFGPISPPEPMMPIPISVPLQASLSPVSLQHVQLVPCMCPVAAEEAEKLQEAAGPGPYIAQPAPLGQEQKPMISKLQ